MLKIAGFGSIKEPPNFTEFCTDEYRHCRSNITPLKVKVVLFTQVKVQKYLLLEVQYR